VSFFEDTSFLEKKKKKKFAGATLLSFGVYIFAIWIVIYFDQEEKCKTA